MAASGEKRLPFRLLLVELAEPCAGRFAAYFKPLANIGVSTRDSYGKFFV
jgi:hypothetical protein